MRQSRAISGDAARRVVALLEQARTEIVGKIASVEPQSFSSFQLEQLKRSIEQAMADFRVKATQVIERGRGEGMFLSAGDPR
jgi:hypothetical protein